jgi:hypothetical protein
MAGPLRDHVPYINIPTKDWIFFLLVVVKKFFLPLFQRPQIPPKVAGFYLQTCELHILKKLTAICCTPKVKAKIL